MKSHQNHPKIVGADAKVTNHIAEGRKILRSISDTAVTSKNLHMKSRRESLLMVQNLMRKQGKRDFIMRSLFV